MPQPGCGRKPKLFASAPVLLAAFVASPAQEPAVRTRAFEVAAGNELLVHGGVVEESGGDVRTVSLPRFLLDPLASLNGVIG
jgi:hypothetical protein